MRPVGLTLLPLLLLLASLSWAAPAAAQSSSPIAACGRGASWLKVAGPGDNSLPYALAASEDRIFVSGLRDSSAGQYATWTGRLDASSLLQASDPPMGRQVTDLLVTPGLSTTLAWASGFGNNPVYGAPPQSPLSFVQRGSFDAWPMQLMQAGDQVYAAAAKPGAEGVYRWNGSDWQLAGGQEITPVSTAPLGFWASGRGGGRLWLGTERRGLWSADESTAAEWEWMGDAELRASTVTAVAVDPRDPTHLLAGLGPNLEGQSSYRGLRRSFDGGANWSRPLFASDPVRGPEYIAALVYSRLHEGLIIAAPYGHGLHLSPDGGISWQRMVQPPDFRLNGGYFLDLAVTQPAGQPGCELLFAAGRGGLWVRDIAGLPDWQAYVPYANQAMANWPTATTPASGSDGRPAAPSFVGPFAAPTPTAPARQLPSGSRAGNR
jgi:hypothetical protein